MCLSFLPVLPEGLGVLTSYVQLGGGGGTGGVVMTQSRVLDKLSERNPAALFRRMSSCWTTAQKQEGQHETRIMYGLLLLCAGLSIMQFGRYYTAEVQLCI